MTIAATVRAALADLRCATILVAEAGSRVHDLLEEMRSVDGDVIVLVIDPGVTALDRAMLVAALGPLAAELAPAVRIGVIDVVEGALPDHIDAAARFLATARSSTGQLLTVSPEP